MSIWNPQEPGKTKLGPQWKEAGRLAMRVEGDNWNAYYALPHTMDGALWLGSIKFAFVEGNPTRRKQFLDMMKEAVADILEETTGDRPTWSGERKAPENERTKE